MRGRPTRSAARHPSPITWIVILDLCLVLVAGVVSGWGDTSSAIATAVTGAPADSFTATRKPMKVSRAGAQLVLLPNNKVLIGGGYDNNLRTLPRADLYNPVKDRFTVTSAPMTEARYSATATVLPGGKVLIAGGVGTSGQALDSAELYEPATNTFKRVKSRMSFARFSATATLCRPARCSLPEEEALPMLLPVWLVRIFTIPRLIRLRRAKAT